MTDADDELLHGLRRGDETAFRALLGRHHARMVSLATAFVINRSAAEEVVQETWLAVIEGLPSLRASEALTAWIYRILVNKARRRGARDKRLTLFSDLTTTDDTAPTADPDLFTPRGSWASAVVPWDELHPERVVAGRQLWAQVQEAIDRLPARQRAVLLLCDIEQTSGSEASRILGLSEANQRVLLHRARIAVRQAIDTLLWQT